jgi:hypothetical protein
MNNPVKAALNPGLRYGAIAFLMGAAFGPVRELLLAPLLGGLPAAVIEALVLAPAFWWLARSCTTLIEDAPEWQATASLVLFGLVVVLLAESLLAAVLLKTGLAAQRVAPAEAERAIGYALIAWFCAAPFLARRRG